MNKKKALSHLEHFKTLAKGDPEAAHSRADEVLCEFLSSIGHEDIVKAWLAIEPKWYA